MLLMKASTPQKEWCLGILQILLYPWTGAKPFLISKRHLPRFGWYEKILCPNLSSN